MSNRLMAAKLKDFHLKNIERSEYQLICDRGGGFVEAISLLAEKKTASPFHSVSLRVFVCVGGKCFRLLI